MDETRNLILIKGENKTWQIEHCCYDPQEQRYHVTFTNGRTYPYSYSSVQWLQDPEVLNPELYHIAKDGKLFMESNLSMCLRTSTNGGTWYSTMAAEELSARANYI